jgi:hypothetical protein
MSTPIEYPSSTLPVVAPVTVIPYEARLKADWEWAMNESSLFFEGKGKLQQTLRRIVQRLDKHQIPYAVAGGIALFHHGHERYTEDVDLLVTRAGLESIYEHLEGLGYIRPVATSKYLRDTETGVKIDFLLTGGFPGDGRPKEVTFPDPSSVAEVSNGIRFVNLPTFINLKLASGMTGRDRDKDLTDVVELIKSTRLPESLVDELAPSVQAKYRELVRRVSSGKQFVLFDDRLPQEQIDAMLRDGIVPTPDGRLVTSDPALAAKYKMVPAVDESSD